MPALTSLQKSRLETLQLIGTDPQKSAVKTLYEQANGDWNIFATAVAGNDALGAAFLEQLKWANTLADWSAVVNDAGEVEKDDSALVKAVLADANVKTLRALALSYGLAQLETLVKNVSSDTTDDEAKKRAKQLRARLFRAKLYPPEPTAVLARMVEDREINVSIEARGPLIDFLRNTPDFAFEKVSGSELTMTAPMLASIPEAIRAKVIEQLQELDLAEEIAPTRYNGGTGSDSEDAMARPAIRRKLKIFHATVQVTRVEEWFVEADSAEAARALLESGGGHRAAVGECVNFEIDSVLE